MNGLTGVRRQAAVARGVTLTELLIAVLLGLVLLATVLSVVVSTARTNETLSALARTQDAGRLALFLLERDIRGAGYRGCAFGVINGLLDEGSAAYDDAFYDFNAPLFGVTAATTAALPDDLLSAEFDVLYARGDILVVKSATVPLGWRVDADVARNDEAVTISEAVDLPLGRLVLINDCNGGGDLFQIATDDPMPSARLERNAAIDGIEPGNLAPAAAPFSRYYDAEETELLAAESNVYYVGFQLAEDGGPGPTTGLRRVRMGQRRGGTPPDEELLGGVFDMRFEYGVDDSSNGQADRYLTADAIAAETWEKVVSVRVGLLVYSGDDLPSPPLGEAYSLPFDETLWDFPDGQEVADALGTEDEKRLLPPDGNLYRFFSTTVAIRNRVP